MTEHRPVPLLVKRGICHVVYVYDVGFQIDLDKCKECLAAHAPDGKLRQNRRAPRYFDYQPPPLRVTQEVTPSVIAGYRTSASVDLVLYDVGAVAVTYAVPFDGPFENVRSLSYELYDNELLLNDSRQRVEDLLEAMRRAVAKPEISPLVEDYAMFQVEDFDPACSAEALCSRYGQELAQILRAEKVKLSKQEIEDAVSCRIAYGRNDLTVIDWNAALVFDREADDVRAVLEFANVELLEMRFLDKQLDESLDRSYDVLASLSWRRVLGISTGATLRLVGEMQVDGATLFERVNNTLKLMGDQYLARLYRLASQRFHLDEWDAGILRKLNTIDDLYKKISDRNANRRLEILEWIIILLIALEIVMPFMQRLFGR